MQMDYNEEYYQTLAKILEITLDSETPPEKLEQVLQLLQQADPDTTPHEKSQLPSGTFSSMELIDRMRPYLSEYTYDFLLHHFVVRYFMEG